MKSSFYSFMALAITLTACQKENPAENILSQDAVSQINDNKEYIYNEGPIELGKQIDIPYSVSNLKKALGNLPEQTRALIPESEIVATHYYVKFSPKNEEELSILKNNPELILSEYPLDREILVDGCSYHDPSLPENMPTYQYATIEASYWKRLSDTLSVENEVLIEAFMPDYYDDDVQTRAGQDIEPSALEALMAEAYRMTGNEYEPETKGSKWFPSGTIRAYDNIKNDLVPIKRLKVRGTHLLKTIEALTDENGHYSFPHSFKNKATMRIVWESDRWDIRDGRTYQAYFNGPKMKGGEWNVDIGDGDLKALRYAAIHRAAYRHYFGDNCNLGRPQNTDKEKIAYMHDNTDNETYYGCYFGQKPLMFREIEIIGKHGNKRRKPSEIYSTTAHELTHVAHYTMTDNKYGGDEDRMVESWARYGQYMLTIQEYKELGVEDRLFTEISFSINGKTETWIFPDLQYNFQQTDIINNPKYTTFFIDLYDNYNQRQFFINTGNSLARNVPNDMISGINPAILQVFLLKCKTFADVKNELLEFAKKPNAYNVTQDSIEQFFELYE